MTISFIVLVDNLIRLYIILIVVRSLLSWFPSARYKYRSAVMWLEKVTDPPLLLCRRLLPPSKTGGMDFSPIIAILGIQFIWQFLANILIGGR
ncbi:MAG: YggT family protein [Armatimonadota bacterium]